MPEGVAPASIILQDVVREGFKDLTDDSGRDDWIVVLFDNLLIMADSPEQMAGNSMSRVDMV